MKLTDGSLRNPAAVVVVLALVIALGIFSLVKLPFQLFPDIEEPQMTIFTGWRAAAPAEVESELIEPQEAALQGLPGLKQLNAFANAGGSWINLRFNVNTDMQKALIDVISRMNQLSNLPRDATPPVVQTGADDARRAARRSPAHCRTRSRPCPNQPRPRSVRPGRGRTGSWTSPDHVTGS